jgi:glycosyltransferase involved in cell wall biosynthesis
MIHSANLVGSVSRLNGGLFDSVRRLVQDLGNCHVDSEVYSPVDQYTAEDISAWEPIRTHVYSVIGPRSFAFTPRLLGDLTAQSPDLLHCHGTWQYFNLACSLWARRHRRPYIVSPQGMLDPWALRNHGQRKAVASMLYQRWVLANATCMRALCEPEVQAFRTYGLRNPIAVVPNAVDFPGPSSAEAPWAGTVQGHPKILLFIGRIHPKKGLPNLIAALELLEKRKDHGLSRWHLVIAGWDQGGHENELKAQAASQGVANRITFVGPLYGESKQAALSRADAYILPSFSEGLPVAVLEAFVNALPVVMTPECNLPEGFDTGAAIRIECEKESIVRGLQSLFSMTDDRLQTMGQCGVALVQERFTWPKIAAQMRMVYEWLVGKAARPECVLLT